MKSLSVWLKLAPVYAVIIAMVFFSAVINYNRQLAAKAYASQLLKDRQSTTIADQAFKSGQPIRILIPTVGINIPIQPGVFDSISKQWVVSQNSAHFATVTATPNNTSGNTLIYAHNTSFLFGPTTGLKINDSAYIQTDNNLVFEYQFVDSDLVLPTDVAVLKTQKEIGLNLLTCAGTWDSQRRLMHFKFVRVV